MKGFNHSKPITEETRKKMSEASKRTLNGFKKGHSEFTEENNGMWKGKKVGYHGIHKWLQAKFGKANHCEDKVCLKTSNIFHWALKKDFEYERKRKNFMQLCIRCHRKYDWTEEKRMALQRKRPLSVSVKALVAGGTA